MKAASRRRLGFTLIELLVVIAIIALLVGMLLPAIQRVRESANRATCQNNMHQLGIALHAYNSANRKFPPAGTNYGWCYNDPATPDRGDSPILNSNGLLLLLPYLEQVPLFKRYDPTQCASHQDTTYCCQSSLFPRQPTPPLAGDAVASGNAVVVSTELHVFQCPSDSGEKFHWDSAAYGIKAGSGYRGAKTNYDFTSSGDFRCNAWRYLEYPGSRRMFGESSNTRIAYILDGTSNTIMMVETTRDVYNGTCSPWGYRGWVHTGVNPTMWGCHINQWDWPGVIATPKPGVLRSWAHPGSLHITGCNFLMADGAVRFLTESTNLTTLESMSTMAGSEIFEMPD